MRLERQQLEEKSHRKQNRGRKLNSSRDGMQKVITSNIFGLWNVEWKLEKIANRMTGTFTYLNFKGGLYPSTSQVTYGRMVSEWV